MKIGNLLNNISVAQNSQTSEERLREVAALYEREFSRQLVKSMRATIPKSGLVTENQAEKIFSEELYNHYGDLMADRGPQSLRDHIYKNLVERFGAQMGIRDKSLKSHGIVPFPVQANSSTIIEHSNDANSLQYRFQWDEVRQLNDASVVSPLGGTVLNVSEIGEHNALSLTLDHGNGLTSQLKFLGSAKVRVGDQLNAGQQVATLGKMGRELVWNLQSQGLRASSE